MQTASAVFGKLRKKELTVDAINTGDTQLRSMLLLVSEHEHLALSVTSPGRRMW